MTTMDAHYSDSGNAILDVFERADNFTEWLFSEVRPYLSGSILEIGSGAGTYSKKLLRDFPDSRITLSDIDPQYVDMLEKRFGGSTVSVRTLDLGAAQDFATLTEQFDSVIALNVLEHVADDCGALRSVRGVLAPQGRVVLLVPAHPALYNGIDKAIGHYRRYTRRSLAQVVDRAGFTMERQFYFNALSIFGWYLNGNILKKTELDGSLVSFYNRIVPAVRFVERSLFARRVGISLIAVLAPKTGG